MLRRMVETPDRPGPALTDFFSYDEQLPSTCFRAPSVDV